VAEVGWDFFSRQYRMQGIVPGDIPLKVRLKVIVVFPPGNKSD
jgi:hypothetical protein